MIHHSCDRCNRMIGHDELRFVISIDVQAAMGPGNLQSPSPSQLRELHEILDQLDPDDHEEIQAQALSQMQYDLCRDCQEEFILDPLGNQLAPPVSIGFGPN